MQRVFVADHDPSIVDSIADRLAALGYLVEIVHDVGLAIVAARDACAVALIEWGRPMVLGEDVVGHLRECVHCFPILMISDLSMQRATGSLPVHYVDSEWRPVLQTFALAEIAQRLRLQLDHKPSSPRQGAPAEAKDLFSDLNIADLRIERGAGRVWRGGCRIEVTRREYLLLEYLALHHDLPVSRQEIAREVWHVENRATPLDNVIDVHIGRLRRKLTVAGRSSLIHTIRGVGYRLSESADDHKCR